MKLSEYTARRAGALYRMALPEADPPLAIKFIENNCRKNIRCDDVAGEYCLSSKQLGRIFKKSTGISLYDYITNARLKQAKKLLSDSSMSVKEIAFEIGFSEQSSFTSFLSGTAEFLPVISERSNNPYEGNFIMFTISCLIYPNFMIE